MAGQFARAYKNYGSDALDQIKNLFDVIRQKKDQQDFFNNILNAYNQSKQNLQGIGQGTNPNDMTISEQPGGNTFPINPVGPDKGTTVKAPDISSTQGIQDITLPDYTPAGPERYRQGQQELANFQQNEIPNALSPSAPPDALSKISVLGQLLGGQVESLKPNVKQITLGKDQKLMNYNMDTGEITPIADNITKQLDKKVNEFIGTDNQPYITYQKPDGTTYTVNSTTNEPAPKGIKVRDTRSNINVNTGDKPLSNKDVSTLMGNVGESYKQANDIKNIKWTPIKDLVNQIPADKLLDYFKAQRDANGNLILDGKGKPQADLSKDNEGNYTNAMVGGAYIYTPKNGTAQFLSQDQVNQMKEGAKTEGLKSATSLVTGLGLQEPVDVIQQAMQKNNWTSDEALKRFFNDNPNLDYKEKKALKSYFQLLNQ